MRLRYQTFFATPAFANWSANFIKSFMATLVAQPMGSKGHVGNYRGTSIRWRSTWMITFGSGVWQPTFISRVRPPVR